MCIRDSRLAEYVATAFRKATTNVPGPVFLEMPIDLLFEQVDEEQVVFPRQYRTEAGIAGDPRAIEKAFELRRKADAVVSQEVRREGWYERLWQSFAVLLPVQSVGVMGDERTYGYPIIIRAVTSAPKTYRFAMTAPYYVEIGYEPRISKKSAQFFLDWLTERAKRIAITDPAERQAVLQHHRAARDFWQQKIATANAE